MSDESEGSCPCLYVTPCQPNCTCAKPHMSHGCRRCASFGSIHQRKMRAARLAESIDRGNRTDTFSMIHFKGLSNFTPLQVWEGWVDEVIDDKFFSVGLKDITEPRNPDEYAVMKKSEVSAEDLPLVRVGAVFKWQIGYITTEAGQIINGHVLEFLTK